jgi:UDP-GlcNAc:undecaprenyl-phosphate GlcNAc-1-phosphate transferase
MTSLQTVLLALALAGALSAVVRRLPGLSARPKADRWHGALTPMTGGIALFLAFLVAVQPALHAGDIDPRYEPVITIAALAFILGLLDDAISLSINHKLAGQLVVALIAVHEGVRPDWLAPSIAVPVSCAVIVACMNSLNLLDHMDGLAAGTAAVGALGLALVSGLVESAGSPVVAAAVAGACLGFLPFNYRPRRPAALFMGDSGSQLLGFVLGSMALLTSPGGAGGVAAAVVAPLLILAVPAFDTGLVMLVRFAEGRPFWQGGRDHSSHRLVYGGLSERRAVAILIALAASCTGIAVAIVIFQSLLLTMVASSAVLAGLLVFGARLALLSEHGTPSRREPLQWPELRRPSAARSRLPS